MLVIPNAQKIILRYHRNEVYSLLSYLTLSNEEIKTLFVNWAGYLLPLHVLYKNQGVKVCKF